MTVLSPRQRRGAIAAALIGFGLFLIGFDALVVGLLVVLFFVLILFLIGGLSDAFLRDRPEPGAGFAETWIGFFGDAFWPVVVILVLVTLALMTCGLILSAVILRRAGNERATAITWAALALAVAAHLILGIVGWTASTFVTVVDDVDTVMAATALAVFAVSFAAAPFLWWWMAATFHRRRITQDDPSARITI